MYKIHIEDLVINTIIGILESERVSKQRVIVNMEIIYNYRDKSFIDYSVIIKEVEELFYKNRYELLEEAINSIVSNLISIYPEITSLYIKISKPDIIKNCSVSLSKIVKTTSNNTY